MTRKELSDNLLFLAALEMLDRLTEQGLLSEDIYADGSDKIGLNQQSPYSKGGALI